MSEGGTGVVLGVFLFFCMVIYVSFIHNIDLVLLAMSWFCLLYGIVGFFRILLGFSLRFGCLLSRFFMLASVLESVLFFIFILSVA